MTVRPSLTIVRLIPWGTCGYRYVVASGIGHPLVYRAAFRDICETFPDQAVIVVATYPTHCEVLSAYRYTALRPVFKGP